MTTWSKEYRMTLSEKILNVLLDKKEEVKYPKNGDHCTIREMRNGFEIDYGRMYDSPNLNFAKLKALGELFGTEEINVDNYSESGCETCDYGSSYGHTIQITALTHHEEEMAALVNKDLIKCLK